MEPLNFLAPGSARAVKEGCTCSVIDNHYGRGFQGDAARFGWMQRMDCPLHGAGMPEYPPPPNLPCGLPDDLGQDDLDDLMMDFAPLAVGVASALGLLVLAAGHLAGWW